MKRRILLLAGSLTLASVLVVLLFRLLGLTLGDVADLLAETPAWLLGAVLALVVANQLVGVERWRAAAAWLHPDTPQIGYLTMFESTTWGTLVGQFVPAQFSITLARWAAARNAATVSASLYEQLFGLIILGAGGIAAALALVLHMSNAVSLIVFVLAMLLGCLSLRWMLALGNAVAGRYARTRLPGALLATRLAGPLGRASRAPAATLAVLCGWSLARLILLSLRTLLIAYAFLSGIDWTVVVIGSPIVGLAVSVPFLPAGLGLAEWSWTGLLVLAGAAAPDAALTAVVFRIINFAALCATVIITTLLAKSGKGVDRKQAGASPS